MKFLPIVCVLVCSLAVAKADGQNPLGSMFQMFQSMMTPQMKDMIGKAMEALKNPGEMMGKIQEMMEHSGSMGQKGQEMLKEAMEKFNKMKDNPSAGSGGMAELMESLKKMASQG